MLSAGVVPLSKTLPNSVIYSVGGTDGGDRYTAVNAYHPATNVWTPVANMHVGREGPAVAFVAGKLYAFGGWTASQTAATAD